MIKTYSELIQFETFIERYNYLKLCSSIGIETFGHSRYINQILYRSEEWNSFRREIIIRDNGCDLGVEGFDITGTFIVIHHINPITIEQVMNRDKRIFDPENAITTKHSTHMAIHYGSLTEQDISLLERRANDTCPWKH